MKWTSFLVPALLMLAAAWAAPAFDARRALELRGAEKKFATDDGPSPIELDIIELKLRGAMDQTPARSPGEELLKLVLGQKEPATPAQELFRLVEDRKSPETPMEKLLTLLKKQKQPLTPEQKLLMQLEKLDSGMTPEKELLMLLSRKSQHATSDEELLIRLKKQELMRQLKAQVPNLTPEQELLLRLLSDDPQITAEQELALLLKLQGSHKTQDQALVMRLKKEEMLRLLKENLPNLTPEQELLLRLLDEDADLTTEQKLAILLKVESPQISSEQELMMRFKKQELMRHIKAQAPKLTPEQELLIRLLDKESDITTDQKLAIILKLEEQGKNSEENPMLRLEELMLKDRFNNGESGDCPEKELIQLIRGQSSQKNPEEELLQKLEDIGQKETPEQMLLDKLQKHGSTHDPEQEILEHLQDIRSPPSPKDELLKLLGGDSEVLSPEERLAIQFPALALLTKSGDEMEKTLYEQMTRDMRELTVDEMIFIQRNADQVQQIMHRIEILLFMKVHTMKPMTTEQMHAQELALVLLRRARTQNAEQWRHEQELLLMLYRSGETSLLTTATAYHRLMASMDSKPVMDIGKLLLEIKVQAMMPQTPMRNASNTQQASADEETSASTGKLSPSLEETLLEKLFSHESHVIRELLKKQLEGGKASKTPEQMVLEGLVKRRSQLTPEQELLEHLSQNSGPLSLQDKMALHFPAVALLTLHANQVEMALSDQLNDRMREFTVDELLYIHHTTENIKQTMHHLEIFVLMSMHTMKNMTAEQMHAQELVLLMLRHARQQNAQQWRQEQEVLFVLYRSGAISLLTTAELYHRAMINTMESQPVKEFLKLFFEAKMGLLKPHMPMFNVTAPPTVTPDAELAAPASFDDEKTGIIEALLKRLASPPKTKSPEEIAMALLKKDSPPLTPEQTFLEQIRKHKSRMTPEEQLITLLSKGRSPVDPEEIAIELLKESHSPSTPEKEAHDHKFKSSETPQEKLLQLLGEDSSILSPEDRLALQFPAVALLARSGEEMEKTLYEQITRDMRELTVDEMIFIQRNADQVQQILHRIEILLFMKVHTMKSMTAEQMHAQELALVLLRRARTQNVEQWRHEQELLLMLYRSGETSLLTTATAYHRLMEAMDSKPVMDPSKFLHELLEMKIKAAIPPMPVRNGNGTQQMTAEDETQESVDDKTSTSLERDLLERIFEHSAQITPEEILKMQLEERSGSSMIPKRFLMDGFMERRSQMTPEQELLERLSQNSGSLSVEDKMALHFPVVALLTLAASEAEKSINEQVNDRMREFTVDELIYIHRTTENIEQTMHHLEIFILMSMHTMKNMTAEQMHAQELVLLILRRARQENAQQQRQEQALMLMLYRSGATSLLTTAELYHRSMIKAAESQPIKEFLKLFIEAKAGVLMPPMPRINGTDIPTFSGFVGTTIPQKVDP